MSLTWFRILPIPTPVSSLNYIWKDGREDIRVKELWELLATYVYLPRLRDSKTLEQAITDGAASTDYFGYATSKNADGTYAGLAFGRRTSVFVDDLSVLVRRDVAAKAAAVEKGAEAPPVGPEDGGKPGGDVGPDGGPGPVVPAAAPRRFYGTIRLNPQRLAGCAGQVGEEVLQHLASLVDSEVEVVLEITVKVPDGIPDKVVRTVSENANALKFESFEFESE